MWNLNRDVFVTGLEMVKKHEFSIRPFLSTSRTAIIGGISDSSFDHFLLCAKRSKMVIYIVYNTIYIEYRNSYSDMGRAYFESVNVWSFSFRMREEIYDHFEEG